MLPHPPSHCQDRLTHPACPRAPYRPSYPRLLISSMLRPRSPVSRSRSSATLCRFDLLVAAGLGERVAVEDLALGDLGREARSESRRIASQWLVERFRRVD